MLMLSKLEDQTLDLKGDTESVLMIRKGEDFFFRFMISDNTKCRNDDWNFQFQYDAAV